MTFISQQQIRFFSSSQLAQLFLQGPTDVFTSTESSLSFLQVKFLLGLARSQLRYRKCGFIIIYKLILNIMYDNLTFKTIVLGPQGSGKSSVLLRYLKGQFSEKYSVTVGVQFASKSIEVEDSKIRMQVWDTSGQQVFRAVVRSFYKGIAGIFLTFALNDFSSMEGVRAWAKQALNYAHEQVVLFLIGTKCDLEQQRKVTEEEGINLSKEIGAAFYIETSAKFNINIEETFKKSANLMYKKFLINDNFKNLVNPYLNEGLSDMRAESFNLNRVSMQSSKRKCCN